MSLILNFSPIEFDDREISVGRLPFGSDGDQKLERLRDEHNGTHVFRRQGADSILAVSVAPDVPLIGKSETIRLKEHLGLVAALVRNALLTYLTGLGRSALSYSPLEFIARDDLLRACVAAADAPPDWLGVHLLYEIEVRPIYFFKRCPFIAVVVDVRTTRCVERTAQELIDDGLLLEGFYVGRRVKTNDPRIAPRFELLGCVKSIEGSQLRLSDSRDGIETVEAGDVWLEKSVFSLCLSHVYGKRAGVVAKALECERAALRHGPTRLEFIAKTVAFLGDQSHTMAPGVPFRFGQLVDSSMDLFPYRETAPPPIYEFDSDGFQDGDAARSRIEPVRALYCPGIYAERAQDLRRMPTVNERPGRAVPSQVCRWH